MNPVIHHPTLGQLTYDPHLNWYSGQLQDLEIQLSLDECHDLPDLLQFTQSLVQQIQRLDQQAAQYAAEQLLELHNDTWNEGPPITAQEFTRQITLQALTTYPDHSAELYYHDGGLFWGHTILVTLQPGPQFTSATIAG
jgi:hypothetical protein